MDDTTERFVRFEDFEVDLEAGELRRDGHRIAIQDKVYQLLVALLERPGEIVSRDVLRQRLWPDVIVDFDVNLNALARKLREALGDSATEPRFVETVPRRGYRFIGTLERRHSRSDHRLAGLRWIAVLAITAGLGWAVAAGLRPTEEPPPRVMLAVLPFDNFSGQPEREYLSDGMTEELLTALGKLQPERLGVIARVTSMTYKGTSKPIDEIGRELEVDYVVEGSVRGTDDKTRVTAQLIAVSDQTHLWAETYDTDLRDLLDVQEAIARRIANALALELLGEDPRSTGSDVPDAYDHYLRGRYQWNRFTDEGNRLAIAELRRSIELDPEFAAAWSALADAYNLTAFDGDGHPGTWFRQARQAAERAIELDPELASAHHSLAFAVLYGDQDPAAAEPIFSRGRDLNPNYAMGFHWWAGALAALGRHDEAIGAARRALELDPLSLSVRSDLGWYYLFADRWQDAIRECRATLAASPDYRWAKVCLIEGLLRAGREADAVRLATEVFGEGAAAAESFEEILRLYLEDELAKEESEADPLFRGLLYGRLGQPDEALDWLEQARENGVPWLVFLPVDPRFDALHDEPRFRALAGG